MQGLPDMKGPVAMPAAPPPKPVADATRAPWEALPLPVCPRLLAPETREHMAALALFAQALREAAEAPGGRDERIGRVETLELALSGAFGPALSRPELLPAVILRESLLATGGSFADMLALADAVKDAIAGADFPDEQALLDHAARATAPVLRQLMLLHGVREEPLLARADELARAWHVLERKNMPDAPQLAAGLLKRAGDVSGTVRNRCLKAQLYRLRALAEAALVARSKGLAAIPVLTRWRIGLTARLKRWSG